jgi:Fe-S cluster assembly scaffold protein SufB
MELNEIIIEKIKKRLEKEREIIVKCEASLDKVPESQRKAQEKALEILKNKCAALESKLQTEG